MTRSGILIIGLTLALGATSSMAAIDPSHSYLYTITEKEVKITPLKNGAYLLTGELSNNHAITMFSDRPYRTIQNINEDELQNQWSQGTDSFAIDPPNAALSATKMPFEFISITRFQDTKNQIDFQFNVLNSHASLPNSWLKNSNLNIAMTIH